MINKKVYFKPESVNNFFVDLTALPHGSGNEEQVRHYIIQQIEQYNSHHPRQPVKIIYYNAQAVKPGEQNIILRREGAGKFKDKPVVILQAHLDMVCEPSSDIFPIKLLKYTDDNGIEMLKAGGFSPGDGTTLGADNGVGVAAALALITDPELETGTIECLFTVQEETSLQGVKELDISLLTGSIVINLDSEEYNSITYGSAGGSLTHYQWIPQAEKIPADYKTLFIEISGLNGGHSGNNINEGRANAIKVLARLLDYMRKVKKAAYNIIRFTTTNNKNNVIPNNAQITLAYPPGNNRSLQDNFRQLLAIYKEEYKESDPDFTWRTEEIGNPHYMLSADYTNGLLDMLLQIPYGPLKMDTGVHKIVEASVNISFIEVDYQCIVIECSNRGAREESLDTIESMHRIIAEFFRIKQIIQLDAQFISGVLRNDYLKERNNVLIISNRYPSWQPDQNSELLKVAEEVYREIYGKDNYIKEAVHAGLDCSWLMEKFYQSRRKVECIAIGPTIKTPHSWNERLETATVQPFYDCLIRIIRRIQS